LPSGLTGIPGVAGDPTCTRTPPLTRRGCPASFSGGWRVCVYVCVCVCVLSQMLAGIDWAARNGERALRAGVPTDLQYASDCVDVLRVFALKATKLGLTFGTCSFNPVATA